MTLKLYGIPNCDTVKKARLWLQAHHIDYEFFDFKKMHVTETLLADWIQQIGWQALLKKTGKTWSQELSAEDKAAIQDERTALAALLKYHNLIKRPVLTGNGKILSIGFKSHYENSILADFLNKHAE